MTYMTLRNARGAGAQSKHCNSGANGAARLVAVALALTAWLPTAPVEAQTWSLIAEPTGEGFLSVVYSTASTAAAVGTNSATIASGDGGSTWADETVATLLGGDGSPDLNAVFSNAATIIGVGDDQMGAAPEAVITSSDRGATWVEVLLANLPPTDNNLVDGLFVNSTNAVAITDQMGAGEVLLSVDRGASWTNPFVALERLNAVDSRGALVIAVGDDLPTETLVYSPDSGVTWFAGAGPATGQDMNDVFVVSATTAVAVGQGGQVLQTTDSGANWGNAFIAADNLNAIDGRGVFLIAVGDSRTIVRSIDSGANWVLPTTPPPVGATNLNAVLFLTSAIALAVGDNGEVYGTTDRGDVWTAQTSTTTDNLEAIAYNGVNNTLVVGANGTVLLSLNQLSITAPIPFRSKWPLVLLLVGAGLVALRRLRTAR